MHVEDVHKVYFRTYVGHCNFIVIPFELCITLQHFKTPQKNCLNHASICLLLCSLTTF